MPLSKESLKALVALQEQDKVLDGFQSDLERIPAEIEALRAKFELEKARLSGAKTQVLDLEKKKKEKELELAQKEEAVLKHSRDLNAVKTNEAFKALQAEIDKAKADAGQIETEILEVMEKIDESRRAEKTAASEVSGIEKGIKDEIAALESKKSGIQGRFDAGKSGRDQAAAGLDAEVLKIYTHIRTRGKLNAVVPVDGRHCGACRMALAPQVIVELTKAKNVVLCESCQRILYHPGSLAAVGASPNGAGQI